MTGFVIYPHASDLSKALSEAAYELCTAGVDERSARDTWEKARARKTSARKKLDDAFCAVIADANEIELDDFGIQQVKP